MQSRIRLGELLNVSKESALGAVNGLASNDHPQIAMSERQALAIDGRSPKNTIRYIRRAELIVQI